MLDRKEWMTVADTAAAAEWGRQHKNLLAARRGIVPISLLAGIIGLILAVRWAWHEVTGSGTKTGTDTRAAALEQSANLPTAFWVVAALALVATLIAFRPKSTVTPAHILLVKIVVTVIVWLGLAIYAVAFLAT